MTLPRWIKLDESTVKEAPASPRFRREWYETNGYLAVPEALATLPLSRLGIEENAVVEVLEPEATTETVSKKAVISVLKNMIDSANLETPETLKNILGGIAELTTDRAPGDDFDLLDSHVSEFLTPMGITVDELRTALATSGAV